jgi:peroxiredoxin Q/BCP
LADEDKSVIEALASGDLKKFMEKSTMVFTETFVIDENGIIDEVIEKVKTKAHAEQIPSKYFIY